MNNIINFEDIKNDIIDIGIYDKAITGSMYTDQAVGIGDIVIKGDTQFKCTESYDNTTDEEAEEGLSYRKIRLEVIS